MEMNYIDADLLAMDHAKWCKNNNGLLILAVPIGEEDKLEWNAHRVYGPLRLPLLLNENDWIIEDTHPKISNFKCDILQPLFILRRK
jgi:hypothetical protein